MADNTITIVGNVTSDPELRFTPAGRPVANFTVAVNRRFKDSDGTWQDKLDGFFDCQVWGDMAENVAESLPKGTRVVLTGRLNQRSWETQEGDKRSKIEISVDEVGPSLKWATAQVQKSQRSGGRSGSGGDWGQGGAQQGGGQGGQSGQGGSQWGGQGGQGGAQQGGGQGAGTSWGQPAGGGGSDWGTTAPVGGGTQEGDF